ncbi:MAG: fibronectin-binding domain-containing protein [Fimbriimonadia bacterium]|jgi:predicted ribosome quality control (RQC) complex YloA/Tae2 family protein
MSFRAPFDSTVLAAVVAECRKLVGGRLQRISQPDEHTLCLQVYCGGPLLVLLLCCDAQFARAHLTAVRPANPQPTPAFCSMARKWTENGRITDVRMRGMDRVLEVEVIGEGGRTFTYIGEFMGKHSNVMLLDDTGLVLGALKTVGAKQSRRQVRAGLRYQPPPPIGGLDPRILTPDEFEALARDAEEIGPDWLRQTVQGVSPFLAERLWELGGARREGLREAYATWREVLLANDWRPVAYRAKGGASLGAYPIAFPPPPGVTVAERRSLCEALDAHYLSLVAAGKMDQERAHLRTALSRALSATERALDDVQARLSDADLARRWQVFAELILAYAHTLEPGATTLLAPDYTDPTGAEVEIALDGNLTPAENAELYFRKARSARQAEPALRERLVLLSRARDDLLALLARLDDMRAQELAEARNEATLRGWLRTQESQRGEKEERPFDGHRIRRVHTAEGLDILYGESATANDYLTQRVAKPNDWWLHVRGGVSAHAIVPTGNRPADVPRSVLERAAQLVARNSPAKHSSLVAVDYTLRKFVRKPRGAAPGLVTYSHEKTLHVTPLKDG